MFQNHFPMVLIHKKKHLQELVGTTPCLMENTWETESKQSIELFIPFPKGPKSNPPFPMAQKQKAHHQLNCSYPFPRVQKQVPFAQGPRNREETIIWTVHTLSQGSKDCPYTFPRAQKQKSNNHLDCSYPFSRVQRLPIPFPKGCSCCWSCFCHYC